MTGVFFENERIVHVELLVLSDKIVADKFWNIIHKQANKLFGLVTPSFGHATRIANTAKPELNITSPFFWLLKK